MRSLDTSLPNHHGRRRQRPSQKASAELLQAFKAAALSVTQLYKTATATAEEEDDNVEGGGALTEANLQEAHESGYQAALDELLGFLDEGELGLGDGEGWSVREWATRRLRGVDSMVAEENGEKEEEHMRIDGESLRYAGVESSSPDSRRRKPRPRTSSLERARTVQQAGTQSSRSLQSSSPLPDARDQQQQQTQQPQQQQQQASRTTVNSHEVQNHAPDVFHFRSVPPTQSRQQPSHDTSSVSSSTESTPNLPSRRSPTAIRLEIKPTTRSTRSHNRNPHTHTNHQRMLERGSSGLSATVGLGHGAGAKRKGGFMDMEFFDFSGAGDEYGGCKRGRLG